MGPEFLITIKWCTILDGTRKEVLQKEQKCSFSEWKNRFLQYPNMEKLQNMSMKLEDPRMLNPQKRGGGTGNQVCLKIL